MFWAPRLIIHVTVSDQSIGWMNELINECILVPQLDCRQIKNKCCMFSFVASNRFLGCDSLCMRIGFHNKNGIICVISTYVCVISKWIPFSASLHCNPKPHPVIQFFQAEILRHLWAYEPTVVNLTLECEGELDQSPLSVAQRFLICQTGCSCCYLAGDLFTL